MKFVHKTATKTICVVVKPNNGTPFNNNGI